MASSSSLSFASPSLSQTWFYDVFPSFHGSDVRRNFLSHVLKEFRGKSINFFVDNEMERGEFFRPVLERAIRGSKIAIVFLSKNYASSSWCLDELVEIMKNELCQKVVIIFYEVDPTDVRKQKGDFGEAFKKTCEGKDSEKVETWRKALEAVATITGYQSKNWDNDATMIEDIAVDISNMLNLLAPSPHCDRLIGMEAHMEMMEPLLRLDLDEVRMVGLLGQPGIGKTTIARVLFGKLSSSFQNRAFMENIKGNYQRSGVDENIVHLQLQTQMLSKMFNNKSIEVSHLGVAPERLRNSKVLLVLDDVDRLAQLEALAKNIQWFGPGSRIIITTEYLQLYRAHGIKHIYKVKFPSSDEALQMFCMYAFDQKFPKDGFNALACEITYLVGELPLGLKVMGSHFRGLSKEQWSMEVSRLGSNLDGEIESVLKFSYDALCSEDKELFLHIACLFDYSEREYVEEILAKRFKDLSQRLDVLKEKSLISIERGYIRMHKLLAQLGKEIVRKDREPWQRKFLFDNEDICEVLLPGYPTITGSVVGINSMDRLNITEKAFEGMSNLQFLRVVGDHDVYINNHFYSPQNYKFSRGPLTFISPKLRLLEWEKFPMTCLRFTNDLEFLVELNMPKSKLEKLWDGIKLLRNLKRMILSYSINLKELPNLSTATNLMVLDLYGCSSLLELPSSIGNLTKLHKLFLQGCSSLVELPSSIGNLTNLETLTLRDCSSLVSLPQLPDSLSFLHAQNCKSLERLDCSFCNPDIRLNFIDCFKLNKEARDLIMIQPSTLECAVLPGKEVPACFTHRAYGSSVTVKLNQKTLCRSTKFKACILVDNKGETDARSLYSETICVYSTKKNKACILLDDKGEHEFGIQERRSLSCRIKFSISESNPILTEHLFMLEFEAEEVTSTELVFDFEISYYSSRTRTIKECGMMQLLDHHHVDGGEEMCGRRSQKRKWSQ